MKNKMAWLVFAFFIFSATGALGVSMGVAIAPATGHFGVPLDGSELIFTVYNTGSEDMYYMLKLEGPAAAFTSYDGGSVLIPHNGYKEMKIKIDPSSQVKDGDSYDLSVKAVLGVGSMITAAESRITLDFHGVRTEPYATEQVSLTPQPAEIKNKETVPLVYVPSNDIFVPLGTAGVILIILGGMFVVFRRYKRRARTPY
jgi:hypothetical protein